MSLNIKWLAVAGMLSMLSLTALAADADKLKMDDFAYGFTIESPVTDKALAQVEIADNIYSLSVKDDLADVRVYDQGGNLIPATLIQQHQQENKVQSQNLAMFKLTSLDSKVGANNDLHLSMKLGEEKLELVLDDKARQIVSDEVQFYALLLPQQATEQEFHQLVFNWQPSAQNWQADVIFYARDRQRYADANGVLANLTDNVGGAEALIDNKVQFKYRLSKEKPLLVAIVPRGDVKLPSIQSVVAERYEQQDGVSYTVVRPNQTLVSSRSELIYEFESARSFDFLDIKLPSWPKNSIGKVNVSYKSELGGTWQELTKNFVVYSFNNKDSDELSKQNAAIKLVNIGPIAALKITDVQGGLVNNLDVSALIRTQHLIFNLQGQPPYTLVVGQARAENVFFKPQELLGEKLYPLVVSGKVAIDKVRLGSKFTLVGAKALQQPKDNPWLKYLVWVLLAAGAACLLFLAGKILREVKKQDILPK